MAWLRRNSPRLLVALTAVGVAALLYDGLYRLALDQLEWPGWKARLFPLAVDAMVALAYWMATRWTARREVRYAWAVVLLGSAGSLVAQALHTHWELFGTPTVAPSWAPYVAAAPVISLGLMLHLLWLEARTQPATPAVPASTARPVGRVAPAAPKVVAERKTARARAASSYLDDPNVAALVARAAGTAKAPPGSLEAIAQACGGVSSSTAKRLVREYRAKPNGVAA